MSDKVFMDTNLLIYAISNDENKRDRIENLFFQPYEFAISTQVINEFINTCIRKNLLPFEGIQQVTNDFFQFFTLFKIEKSTILLAFEMKGKYNFSWYDALIVSVALENNCTILFSEDMQHGLKIDDKMVIKNPFLVHI
jgi:predicted nucleic acid-binding protein